MLSFKRLLENLKKKEVNKMAIDYKEEWKKLENAYGGAGVTIKGEAITIKLGALMSTQIEKTIDDREKLMEEYMKENIMTEIDGADKHYHHVKIVSARKARGSIGTMYVHKEDFDAWCKKKEDE